MPKVLSDDQIAFYRDEGYLYPFDGVGAAEAGAMQDELEAYERREGVSATDLVLKAHLCFRRSYEFVRHPRILDVVEDLIGPDIMALSARFWIKPGRDGSFVSWHQDSAYFGLDPHELVTAWIALTDSNTANGCLRVLPALAHRRGAPPTSRRSTRRTCWRAARPSRGSTIAAPSTSS